MRARVGAGGRPGKEQGEGKGWAGGRPGGRGGKVPASALAGRARRAREAGHVVSATVRASSSGAPLHTLHGRERGWR